MSRFARISGASCKLLRIWIEARGTIDNCAESEREVGTGVNVKLLRLSFGDISSVPVVRCRTVSPILLQPRER